MPKFDIMILVQSMNIYPCVSKLFYGVLFIIKCNTCRFSKYFSLFNSSFHVHHHAQHNHISTITNTIILTN